MQIRILPKYKGKWCWIRIDGLPTSADLWTSLSLESDDSKPAFWMHYPTALPGGFFRGSRFAVIYISQNVEYLRLYTFTQRQDSGTVTINIGIIARVAAGLFLLGSAPRRFCLLTRASLRGPLKGLLSRFRAKLSLFANPVPREMPYELWMDLFDRWSNPERAALFASPRRSEWPSIGVMLYRSRDDEKAGEASLNGLKEQWLPASEILQCDEATLHLNSEFDRPALANFSADYLAILQAGEVLGSHALAVLADEAARGCPDVLYADEDYINEELIRSAPHFKPELGPTLLVSGILTRGVWLFRRKTLEDLALSLPQHGTAEAERLDLILTFLRLAKTVHSKRVPFILTHRRVDTIAQPPDILGRIVHNYFASLSKSADVDATRIPLLVRENWKGANNDQVDPKISLIVPTGARNRQVAHCLLNVIAETSYSNFDVVLVVSQMTPLTQFQRAILEPLLITGKVKIVMLETERFNFSSATNYGVSASDGELLCLLNDDVEPLTPDWLSIMLGHLADPAVGAVGAKLLYPNGTVQHGGVIMGLAGLCEHANRYLPADKEGYAARANLDQDMSCVTGACLLTRRTTYEQLGGLDESFEIAYNDVDFCLRIRGAALRIIFAATAVLRHYESLSLGDHFSGDRAKLRDSEATKLRQRWHAVFAEDPFYNPNLSLQIGHDWQLACPPRISKPFAEATYPLAPEDMVLTP
jgi:O-antigen biosynthesis protein